MSYLSGAGIPFIKIRTVFPPSPCPTPPQQNGTQSFLTRYPLVTEIKKHHYQEVNLVRMLEVG